MKNEKKAATIFSSAEAWLQTSSVAMSNRGPTFNFALLPASNACAAFALELYFKSLLMLDNQKVPKIHNLKNLYERIKPEWKSRIEEHYKDEGKFAGIEFNESYQKIPIEVRENLFGEKSLIDRLELSQDAFMQLRYFYDPDKEKPMGWNAENVIEAVRNFIFEIKPQWFLNFKIPNKDLEKFKISK